MIVNVINNNFNRLIQKSGVTLPQGRKLKELGIQILKEGEVQLRKLKVDSKKSTAKKQGELFGNMLQKGDITSGVNQMIFSRFIRGLEEDDTIAYDLTDEAHPFVDLEAKKGLENVTPVFDGSRRRKEKGFVHHGVGTGKYLLRLDIHNPDTEFLPQKRKEILEEMIPKLHGKGIWAFDRGNDDEKLFSYLSGKNIRFIIRIKENRDFCICDTGEIFSAKNLPEGRYEVYVKKSGGKKKGKTDTLGFDRKHKYLVIKEKHLEEKNPIILLVSTSLKKFSNTELIGKYLQRWGVENQFRKVKQLYNFESILIRKWKRRKNMTALILFIHFLSGIIKQKLEQGKNELNLVFLIAWESLKSFLKKESKDYNDYSFLAFLRTQIPKKFSFFFRFKYPSNNSIPTLFDSCEIF